MADFVPGNIIQTPDFGQMAQGYVQQYRQEEAAKNKFLDDFEQKQGLYLEGYKPAVQESWNNVQSVMDMVAENDTPENRRKLKEAYGEYSTAAGTAQYLSDEYRKSVAAYKANPTKFAVGSDEFLDLTNDYKLRKRSRNEMLDEVNNPFFLQQSIKYDLLNPYDQAKVLLSDSRMKISDFYNDQGQLNRSALRAYAEKRARAQVNADPQNLDKAAAWGGIREGYVGGEDGVITTPQELEFIQGQDEETRNGFIERYVDELATNYVDLVAERLKTKELEKEGPKKKKLPKDTVSLQAAGGKDVEFITLPGALKTTYNVDNKDGTKSSVKGDIIQIGAAPNGELFVTIEREVDTDDYNEFGERNKESTIEYRPATQTEVSKIMSKYGNTYDFSSLNNSVQENPNDRLGLGF
jgi:hypothetical protein